MGDGEAFDDGWVGAFEGIEVVLVAGEALVVGVLVGEGGVSAPAGVGEVLLGWDECGGGEEGEPGDEKEVARVDGSEEGTGVGVVSGHVLYVSAGRAGLLDGIAGSGVGCGF